MNNTSVLDSLFNSNVRIGNDPCDMTNRNKENIAAADYMLENYSSINSINKALELSVNQPSINLQGSVKGGINSDYVDQNNKLIFSQNANLRERGLIQKRMFNTVPYLGKGPSNTPLENQLRGAYQYKCKSNDPTSEVTKYDLTYIPLVPSLEMTIGNPANCVEGEADEGWIRGGIPSRLYTKMDQS